MRALSLRRRGQSTVEFALMIPVMITIFFWIIEANVYFTSLHVTAFAAYASARSLLVCDPKEQQLGSFYNGPASTYGGGQADCADWINNETKGPILSGNLFANSPYTLTLTREPNTAYNKAQYDGVTIETDDVAEMPYTRFLLNYCPPGQDPNSPSYHCESPSNIPTHLGPSGFDPGWAPCNSGNGKGYFCDSGGDLTDNNHQDDGVGSSGGYAGNGHGNNGGGGGGGGGFGHGNGNHNGNQNGNHNGNGHGHGNGG